MFAAVEMTRQAALRFPGFGRQQVTLEPKNRLYESLVERYLHVEQKPRPNTPARGHCGFVFMNKCLLAAQASFCH